MRQTPRVPTRLSPEAKRLWRQIHAEYLIDDRHGLLLLETALECFDRMRAAQAEIAEHGVVIRDRYDQIKTNPANVVERDQKAQMLLALKQLGLNLESVPDRRPGRPPGR